MEKSLNVITDWVSADRGGFTLGFGVNIRIVRPWCGSWLAIRPGAEQIFKTAAEAMYWAGR